MDRTSYARRAAEPSPPTVEQRLASLETWAKGTRNALEVWVREHERRDKRWRETHAGDHEALSDHVYALDQQIRRLQ